MDEEVRLTPRQTQVFHRLLCGESPKRIAAALGLSVHTVREHVQAIHKAHGVTSRQQLMARYIGRAVEQSEA